MKATKTPYILIIIFIISAIFSTQETIARDILHLQRYTVADGLPHNIINSITEDSNGDIWIATWNGLCRWHNNTLVSYTETKDHQRLGRISAVWESADGHIEYQSESGDFFSYDPASRIRAKRNDIRKPSLKRNFCDTWGEDKQGLFIHHKQINYHIPYDENSRTESRLRAFFQDSRGRLWFNFNGALCMATFVASPFFHFKSSPESHIPFDATVRSICSTKNGRLLFGTRNAQLHGLTGQPVNLRDNPYAIAEDQTSRLWVAMRDSGICIIPVPYMDMDNKFEVLTGIPVFSLLSRPDINEIWAGTWGKGIHIFNGYDKNPISTDSILGNAHVHSMRKCSNGNVAVCTKSGLYIINPDKHIVFSTDTVLNVISALETKDGDMIFSTMGKGLYHLSFHEADVNPTIHKVKTPYDDVIMDMLYDKEGYLWMIADTRLFRFNTLSETPEIFDANDFGKNLTFTEGASCLHRDSLLYLGVTPGILEINLNELSHYVRTRNLRLTEEKIRIREQRILKISALLSVIAFSILFFIWQRKKRRNKIEITLRKPITCDSDNDFIRKLTAALQQSIEDTDVDMEKIATALGMTRNAFYRRCREVMDSTPAALLQEMRIERACQLMRDGESRIKEVAWKSGFTDAKYFTKVFKSKRGITPTDYITKMEHTEGK